MVRRGKKKMGWMVIGANGERGEAQRSIKGRGLFQSDYRQKMKGGTSGGCLFSRSKCFPVSCVTIRYSAVSQS